jgi:hypothetical protein
VKPLGRTLLGIGLWLFGVGLAGLFLGGEDRGLILVFSGMCCAWGLQIATGSEGGEG